MLSHILEIKIYKFEEKNNTQTLNYIVLMEIRIYRLKLKTELVNSTMTCIHSNSKFIYDSINT